MFWVNNERRHCVTDFGVQLISYPLFERAEVLHTVNEPQVIARPLGDGAKKVAQHLTLYEVLECCGRFLAPNVDGFAVDIVPNVGRFLKVLDKVHSAVIEHRPQTLQTVNN